jgi:hypothetical protein
MVLTSAIAESHLSQYWYCLHSRSGGTYLPQSRILDSYRHRDSHDVDDAADGKKDLQNPHLL